MESKTITIPENKINIPYLLHIETELGIINIYTGLTDGGGRRVERIEVVPNNDADEPKVYTTDNIREIRLVEGLRPIPEYAHLMTLEDFIAECKAGNFIDYDGTGYLSTEHYESEIEITPSAVVGMNDFSRYGFTHVTWYNK